MLFAPSLSKLIRLAVVLGLGACAGDVGPSTESREAGSTQARTESVQRPNVVVVMSDDQAARALGCAGDLWARTPGMDRLAREGVRFRNAFVTTSLCSPSRASFLTGLYARTHGIAENHTPLAGDATTFATLLREAGYDTAYVGKWHMGSQAERPGFDYVASYLGQGKYRNCRFLVGRGVQKPTATDGWVDDVATDYALEYLRAEHEEPFLLFLGFKGTHAPQRPPPRHERDFEDVALPEVANAGALPPYPIGEEFEELVRRAGTTRRGYELPQAWQSPGSERTASEEALDWRERKYRDYYRTLEGVDDNVVRVLDTLDALGLDQNTIVVYASDNGMCIGEHSIVGKRAAYEESMRIPLIVRDPRIERAGSVADDLVLNVDLAPTILDLVGLEVPGQMQGHSLRPLLEGRAAALRSDFLYEFYLDDVDSMPTFLPTHRAVRTLAWKLVQYPGFPAWTELFHVAEDPSELANLAGYPEHAERRAQLEARLARLEDELGPRRR